MNIERLVDTAFNTALIVMTLSIAIALVHSLLVMGGAQ